jgi:hypothetical protein
MSLFGIGKKCVMHLSSGDGLEGSDLRRCLPEPSNAVFVLTKTMMGQVDTKHTLSEASRMGRYIVPMLRVVGGDVLYANDRYLI